MIDPELKREVQERIDLANEAEKVQARMKRRMIVTEHDRKLQAKDARLLRRLQNAIRSPLRSKSKHTEDS
ncbi:MAG: hypothetical protein IIZ78_18320 [Clostridiales bacterium]|nr:hypothetical protein [Clostridiales bacterium]